MHDRNNNPWLFLQRYKEGCKKEVNGVVVYPEFELYNGQVVDADTWTLRDHYNFFGIV
jgi:hypothetical protein